MSGYSGGYNFGCNDNWIILLLLIIVIVGFCSWENNDHCCKK